MQVDLPVGFRAVQVGNVVAGERRPFRAIGRDLDVKTPSRLNLLALDVGRDVVAELGFDKHGQVGVSLDAEADRLALIAFDVDALVVLAPRIGPYVNIPTRRAAVVADLVPRVLPWNRPGAA